MKHFANHRILFQTIYYFKMTDSPKCKYYVQCQIFEYVIWNFVKDSLDLCLCTKNKF